MKEQWDSRYATNEYVYGKTPNAWLKQQVDNLVPETILFVAEGEGRNAVYAATKGCAVSAFDQSIEGKRKADDLAKEVGVHIDYIVADALEVEYDKGAYDAVAFIYAHFPAEIRAKAVKTILSFVKPGGSVIFEAYSKQQIDYQAKYHSGGPKELAMLYDIDGIRDEFEGVSFKYLKEEEVLLEEGTLHKGLACVIRFVGIVL